MSLSSFNSRTLGRVRRVYLCGELRHYSVSIHAPWEGCDHVLQLQRVQQEFQFTHPGKGATTANAWRKYLADVSIHAPWEGCDRRRAEGGRYPRRFNSRTLGRVRPGRIERRGWIGLFQFTHPGKGATTRSIAKENRLTVSIHAPWEGCDGSSATYSIVTSSFNSRTLGRVRPNKTNQQIAQKQFQFTHPGKGATSTRSIRAAFAIEFQFTHPGKGATCYICSTEVTG